MKSRFSDEQIIGMIKEYEAGAKAQEVRRKYGISDATFYKYKARFGGMNVSDANVLLPQLTVLTAKSAQFVPLFAAQDVGMSAAVPIRRPDPGVERRDTGLELPSKLLGTSSGYMQLDEI